MDETIARTRNTIRIHFRYDEFDVDFFTDDLNDANNASNATIEEEDDEITEQESYNAFYATGALFWYHCAAVKYGGMEERRRRKGKETIKSGSMKGNLVKDERERLRNFKLLILMVHWRF